MNYKKKYEKYKKKYINFKKLKGGNFDGIDNIKYNISFVGIDCKKINNEKLTFLLDYIQNNSKKIINTYIPFDLEIYGKIKNNQKLYIYTYNIKPNEQNLKLHNIMQFDQLENCANCIVYTLYFNIHNDQNISIIKLTKLLYFLKCIHISTNNINQYFNQHDNEYNAKNPKMCIRIYLDYSVIYSLYMLEKNKCNKIEEIINEIIDILTDLFKNEYVEIYNIFCKENCKYMNITRYYRVLPLIDNEINVCIFKDADGIVTLNECKNIDNFISSDKLIYITYNKLTHNIFVERKKKLKSSIFRVLGLEKRIDVFDSDRYITEINKSRAYSSWIIDYVENNKYFTQNILQLDLLAGLVSFKIKVSPQHFESSIKNVFYFYQEPITKRSNQIKLINEYTINMYNRINKLIKLITTFDNFNFLDHDKNQKYMLEHENDLIEDDDRQIYSGIYIIYNEIEYDKIEYDKINFEEINTKLFESLKFTKEFFLKNKFDYNEAEYVAADIKEYILKIIKDIKPYIDLTKRVKLELTHIVKIFYIIYNSILFFRKELIELCNKKIKKIYTFDEVLLCELFKTVFSLSIDECLIYNNKEFDTVFPFLLYKNFDKDFNIEYIVDTTTTNINIDINNYVKHLIQADINITKKREDIIIKNAIIYFKKHDENITAAYYNLYDQSLMTNLNYNLYNINLVKEYYNIYINKKYIIIKD
jgi:hypothetical protein